MSQNLAKLAELTSRLRSPNEEVDQLFATSQNFICIIGSDAQMIRVSASWVKALGWSADELCSQPFFHFVHPDDMEKTVTAWKLCTETGKVVHNFVNRYLCKDGSHRTLLWNTSATISNGTLYGSASDVTGLVLNG